MNVFQSTMQMFKKRRLLFFTTITGFSLQLYLFMYGCSGPVGEIGPRDYSSVSGSLLYSRHCASCHRLLPPEDYSSQTWGIYVEKYGKSMSESEKQQVLSYLLSSTDNDDLVPSEAEKN